MSHGIEAIKMGLVILRRDKGDNVQSHGIPDPLLRQADSALENISKELEDKINKAFLLYGKGTNVFFLTGEESPEKDMMAVFLLLMMLGAGKVVRYYIATSFDTHDVGQMAIMGIDAAKGLSAVKITSALTSHVHNYKAVVVGGETLESIEAVLGKQLYDYMAHMAVEIKIPSTRDKILEV